MWIFRTVWHWIASWCPLPWERLSPTLRTPWLSVVLCIGLSPVLVLQFTLACLLLSFLLSSCLGRHVGEILWVELPILLGDTASQQIPWSWGSRSLFLPPLPQCFLSLSAGVFWSCIHWYWIPPTAFWLVVVFSSILYICCKDEFSLLDDAN